MNKNIEFYGEHSSVYYADYFITDNTVVIDNIDTLHIIFKDDSQVFRRPEYLFENMDTIIINGQIFKRYVRDKK